ncbi:MAG: MotA/TolQ/ExbB proton channel family protein [Kiritimatiellae bacterium]|nr:MotA/TolQ/ExbB proton channel family protein [Planctomycetales bacterium]MCB1070373.1 MotA/TolQ/ExbB proton channel family protein [Kiritimatiellia bacterium]
MKRSNNNLLPRGLWALTLMALLAVITPIRAQQPESPSPVKINVEQASSESTTLLQLFRLGGWSMWFLLAGSIGAIGLGIYNGLNLRTQKFLHPEVYQEILKRLNAFDFEGTRDYCEQQPVAIARIVHAGLDRVSGAELDLESVEKGMEEAATEEVTSGLVPVNYISVIAVIAPMVGLLGTVSGMIKAFGNMASVGMGRPEVLANNISEALITTASGLIVGIPAMIIYFYFKNRYMGLISSLNRMSGDVLETMKQAAKRAVYDTNG